ncbi:hypothetical protein NIES4106_44720 [Fischerella sp. NIES-4106]|nr:hypothetical protein NIES4106_44720 [Fischerella sp. NIES-4106]
MEMRSPFSINISSHSMGHVKNLSHIFDEIYLSKKILFL